MNITQNIKELVQEMTKREECRNSLLLSHLEDQRTIVYNEALVIMGTYS